LREGERGRERVEKGRERVEKGRDRRNESG
jgi:hypothetical protein